ncbi:chemotaxis regulatory protein ChePep [Helicobacter pylori]
MKMILFNQNPMITKLLESVSKKLELSMEDFNHYQELPTRLKEDPEWILIADDECLEKLDQVDWLELKEIISQNKNSVCMYKKGNEAQPFLEGFEMKIKKPFLPTEVLKVLQKKLGSNMSDLEPSQNLDPTQEVLETNWDELENLGDLEALVQEEPNNEEQLLPTLNTQEEKEEVKEEEKEEVKEEEKEEVKEEEKEEVKEEVKETPQEEEKPKDDETQEGETQKNEEVSKELETQEELEIPKEETQEPTKEQEPIKEKTQEIKEEKQEKTQEIKEEKQEKTQEEVKEETQEQAKEQEPIKEETQENKEEKQEKTQDSPSVQELEVMQELVKEIQENSNSQEDKKETQENTETPQEKEKQELETPQEKEIPQEKETQKLETPQEEIQENTEKTQKLETQEDHYKSIEDIPEPVMAQAMGEELPFLNEAVAKIPNNENDTETPKESAIKTPQEKEESDKTSSPLELRLNLQDLLKSLNQESLKSLLENKTLNIKITLEDKKPDA